MKMMTVEEFKEAVAVLADPNATNDELREAGIVLMRELIRLHEEDIWYFREIISRENKTIKRLVDLGMYLGGNEDEKVY